MTDVLSAFSFCHLSLYPRHSFELGGVSVDVVGAIEVLGHRVEEYLRATTGPWDRERFRSLHLQVPGIYAVVAREKHEVVVATDPYGIVKLFWFQRNGRSLLTDDPHVLRGESLELEPEAIKFFIVCGYTPSSHTFFRGLQKLEPCTLYRIRNGNLEASEFYADLEGDPLSGTAFLERFHALLAREIDDECTYGESGYLCLSGGIDSSFLYELIRSRGMGDRLHPVATQLLGLNQRRPIDNDYDIHYARRLAAMHGQEVTVVTCDMSADDVLQDFLWLQRQLFTEYAPAFLYVQLARAISSEGFVINGQNADSILSFGSTGWPRFSGWSITGLGGLFSRYFYFFGTDFRASPMYAIATFLRHLYYRMHYGSGRQDFSQRSLLLGIGLHPENKFFRPEDPVFASVHDPAALGEWFEGAYLDPLVRDHGYLGSHAQAMLLYNRTYMQGSANRSTVLSFLQQGRQIFLPYTALGLLELMARLKPDWRYAYYGKFPNVAVGRNLGLPEFILNRCDPPDSDSTELLFQCLARNARFREFAREVFCKADLSRYEGILSAPVLDRMKKQQASGELGEWGILMKLLWLELSFATFQVR